MDERWFTYLANQIHEECKGIHSNSHPSQVPGLLRNDPKALIADALSTSSWYIAAASAPANGPTQKIHCAWHTVKNILVFLLELPLYIKTACEKCCRLAVYIKLDIFVVRYYEYMYMCMYLIIPCFFLVVDHGSSKAPSRVDSSAGNRDRSQVHHEHSKPDRQWSQHLCQILINRSKQNPEIRSLNIIIKM